MANVRRAFRYLEAKDKAYREGKGTRTGKKVRIWCMRDRLEIHWIEAKKVGTFWMFWPEHYPAFLQHEDEIQHVEVRGYDEDFELELSEDP